MLSLLRSNRTFMELKLEMKITHQLTILSSNRTFMELKRRRSEESEAETTKVLIVPLWN